MKILYITPQLGKGGAEDILVNLTSHFAKEHNVTLFLFNRYKEDTYNVSRLDKNVKLESFFNSNKALHSKISRLINKLIYLLSPFFSIYIFFNYRFYKYDIIHINMTMSSFYTPFFKLLAIIFPKCNIKFIETFHTNWHLLKKFNKIVFPISWSIVDKVVYEIGEKEDTKIKKYSFATNISYIPFGVPAEEKKENGFLDRFKNDFFNFKEEDFFIIMSIARLRIFEKRFDLILEVLSLIKKEGFDRFKYIICGDGPDRNIIETMIKDFDLIDNVIITGYIDKPQQIVSLSNLYIIAMVDNSTGISGLQAGMANVPVIGVQTSKNYDGKNDEIYSSNNILELKEKILLLLDKNNYTEYKKTSTSYIQEKFNIDKFYSSYKELYNKLMNEK